VPTYQYACTACGEQLEAVQSFTDPALTECPQCGGVLRKVFSAVGVVFKGSGFYKNDSRPAAKTGDAGSGADKGDSAKTDAGKSDSGKTGKGDGGKTDGSPKKEPATPAKPAASTSTTPAAKSA
jgi:putative FmdB family regulatory protein